MDAALDLGEVDHRVAECRAVVPVRERPGDAGEGDARAANRHACADTWSVSRPAAGVRCIVVAPGTRPPQDVERPGIGEGAVSWARGSESWRDRRRAGARRGTPPPRS